MFPPPLSLSLSLSLSHEHNLPKLADLVLSLMFQTSPLSFKMLMFSSCTFKVLDVNYWMEKTDMANNWVATEVRSSDSIFHINTRTRVTDSLHKHIYEVLVDPPTHPHTHIETVKHSHPPINSHSFMLSTQPNVISAKPIVLQILGLIV